MIKLAIIQTIIFHRAFGSVAAKETHLKFVDIVYVYFNSLTLFSFSFSFLFFFEHQRKHFKIIYFLKIKPKCASHEIEKEVEAKVADFVKDINDGSKLQGNVRHSLFLLIYFIFLY